MDQSRKAATTPVDLWDAFEGLRGELERTIGSIDLPGVPGLLDWPSSPAIDLLETDDEVIVIADLPGMGKGELELSVAGNLLSLKGEKPKARDGEGAGIKAKTLRKETWAGGFNRTIELPGQVDPDRVDASMKDGVLTIRVAKREEARRRTVQIAVK